MPNVTYLQTLTVRFTAMLISVSYPSLCQAQGQSIKLKLNIPVGTIIHVSQESDGIAAVKTSDRKTRQSNMIECSLECISIDYNGAMLIKKRFIAAKQMQAIWKGGNWHTEKGFDYDSNDPNKSNAMIGIYYPLVIGKSILIKVNPDGTMDSNDALRIAEQYIKNGQATQKLPQEMREQVKQSLVMNIQTLPCILSYYPPGEYKPGDSWMGPFGTCAKAGVCPFSKWSLKKIEDGIASIEVNDVNDESVTHQKDGPVTKQHFTAAIQLDIRIGVIKLCQGKNKLQTTINEPNGVKTEPNNTSESGEITLASSFSIRTQ